MGGATATLRPRTDQFVVPSAPADTRPDPGWGESIAATFRATRDDQPGHLDEERIVAYGPILDALRERGDPVEYVDLHTGQFYEDGVWRAIERERAKDPRAFTGIPARAEFDRQWRAKLTERQATDADTVRRSDWTPWLAGSVGGAATDPINIGATVLTGGAGAALTPARSILVQALVNAGIEGFEQPLVNQERVAQGRPELTPAERVAGVGVAALTGGLMEGGVRYAPRAAGAIDAAGYRAAAPIRAKFDRFFHDRDLARAFSQQVPEHLRTPEQAAALHVLQREAEIGEGSPYVRTYAGDDAHRAALDRATASLLERGGASGPRAAPAATTFAEVKARIRGPESGGDDAATNALGSSASGRYQFVRGTFKGLYRKVYGASEADAERAWRSRRRFDPQVQEALMDQLLLDNAGALRAAGIAPDAGNLYLAHVLGADGAVKLVRAAPDTPVASLFPAKWIAQNPGYLGGGRTAADALATIRGQVGGDAGRAAPAGAGGEPGDDALLAALDAERADIEMARVRNAGDAPRQGELELGGEAGAPPPLRRDQFDDDASWRLAQRQADAEHFGADAARVADEHAIDLRLRAVAEAAGREAGELRSNFEAWRARDGDDEALRLLEDKERELGLDGGAVPEDLSYDMTPFPPPESGLPPSGFHVFEDAEGRTVSWHPGRGEAIVEGEPAALHGVTADDVRAMLDRPKAAAASSAGAPAKAGSPARPRRSPGELLGQYWQTSPDRKPVWVARDAAGEVTDWSRSRADIEKRLDARADGDDLTMARETAPATSDLPDPGYGDAGLARFADPGAAGVAEQAEGMLHDLRAAVDAGELDGVSFNTGRDGAAETPEVLLARLEADDAALKALRQCL